jgi:hypothetical protein
MCHGGTPHRLEYSKLKVKVKFTLEQATKDQRGEEI